MIAAGTSVGAAGRAFLRGARSTARPGIRAGRTSRRTNMGVPRSRTRRDRPSRTAGRRGQRRTASLKTRCFCRRSRRRGGRRSDRRNRRLHVIVGIIRMARRRRHYPGRLWPCGHVRPCRSFVTVRRTFIMPEDRRSIVAAWILTAGLHHVPTSAIVRARMPYRMRHDSNRRNAMSDRMHRMNTRIRTPIADQIHAHRSSGRTPTRNIMPARTTPFHAYDMRGPVAPEEQPVANTKAYPKSDERSGAPPAHPNVFRIIARNVYDIGLGWLDIDGFLLHHHPLLPLKEQGI